MHADARARALPPTAGQPLARRRTPQDDLKTLGVMVMDKEKVWKAIGLGGARAPYAPPGGGGGGGYGGGGPPMGGGGSWGGGGGGGAYGAPPPPRPSYGGPPPSVGGNGGGGGGGAQGHGSQRGSYTDKDSYHRAVLDGRVQYRAPTEEEDERFARRDRERGRPDGERGGGERGGGGARAVDRPRERERDYPEER